MKVKYTFIAEVDSPFISECVDITFEGYKLIAKDKEDADSCDDFNLSWEILEDC